MTMPVSISKTEIMEPFDALDWLFSSAILLGQRVFLVINGPNVPLATWIQSSPNRASMVIQANTVALGPTCLGGTNGCGDSSNHGNCFIHNFFREHGLEQGAGPYYASVTGDWQHEEMRGTTREAYGQMFTYGAPQNYSWHLTDNMHRVVTDIGIGANGVAELPRSVSYGPGAEFTLRYSYVDPQTGFTPCAVNQLSPTCPYFYYYPETHNFPNNPFNEAAYRDVWVADSLLPDSQAASGKRPQKTFDNFNHRGAMKSWDYLTAGMWSVPFPSEPERISDPMNANNHFALVNDTQVLGSSYGFETPSVAFTMNYLDLPSDQVSKGLLINQDPYSGPNNQSIEVLVVHVLTGGTPQIRLKVREGGNLVSYVSQSIPLTLSPLGFPLNRLHVEYESGIINAWLNGTKLVNNHHVAVSMSDVLYYKGIFTREASCAPGECPAVLALVDMINIQERNSISIQQIANDTGSPEHALNAAPGGETCISYHSDHLLSALTASGLHRFRVENLEDPSLATEVSAQTWYQSVLPAFQQANAITHVYFDEKIANYCFKHNHFDPSFPLHAKKLVVYDQYGELQDFEYYFPLP